MLSKICDLAIDSRTLFFSTSRIGTVYLRRQQFMPRKSGRFLNLDSVLWNKSPILLCEAWERSAHRKTSDSGYTTEAPKSPRCDHHVVVERGFEPKAANHRAIASNRILLYCAAWKNWNLHDPFTFYSRLAQRYRKYIQGEEHFLGTQYGIVAWF